MRGNRLTRLSNLSRLMCDGIGYIKNSEGSRVYIYTPSTARLHEMSPPLARLFKIEVVCRVLVVGDDRIEVNGCEEGPSVRCANWKRGSETH